MRHIIVHENLKYREYLIIHIVVNGKDNENKNTKLNNNSNNVNSNSTDKKQRSLFKTITIMIIAIAVVVVASSFIEQMLEHRYGPYLKIGVVAIIGYFVINSLANVFYRLSYDALKTMRR